MEYNNSSYELILNMYNHIIKNPEWVDFIKNFNDNDNNGFIFSNDQRISDIYKGVNAENDIHSGASFSLCLRKCQSIFNGVRTLDDFK